MLNSSPLSDLELVKIFSQSVGCYFVLLTVSFALQKCFSFVMFHLLVVDLSVCTIGVLFRKLSPMPMHSIYSPLSLLSISLYLVLR